MTLQAATALAADSFDSLPRWRRARLPPRTSRADMGWALRPGDADGGDGCSGARRARWRERWRQGRQWPRAALGLKEVDPSAVPLDELLLNGLVKLAGGAKKGATFATHMPLADLRTAMQERMTAFHRVEVEGEAPSIRKGVLKLITIEMKRAAGHNKTHVSGLESFCISPRRSRKRSR